MRVALTQSEGRLGGLERALQERGFDVLRVPLIQTEPLLTPAVREAARALIGLPWLLFTSPAGVEAWGGAETSFRECLSERLTLRRVWAIKPRGRS